MDHAANDVLNPVKLYNAATKKGTFVALIIRTKGRELECHSEPCPYYLDEKDPVIEDAGVAIKGMDRVIDFLEHKYPAPALTSDDPVHRVATRMLVDNIFESMYPTSRLGKGFEPPAANSFILGRSLSLADLALYPILPSGGAQWDPLRKLILGQI